jgi:uncharacterized protein
VTAPSRARTKPARAAKGPKCPMCGKPITAEYRPFCSKHCADIDLGRWLGGRYVVAGERAAKEVEDED